LHDRATIPCTVIRHVLIEDLGYLGEALAGGGLGCQYVDAQSVDSHTAVTSDALIVLGGPVGAYEAEKYPYLVDEIGLIRRYLDRGLPVLGVCLGSQLLAAACGGRAYPGELGKEIGWAEVELTETGTADRLWSGFPDRFTTFHWHGDTFELPDGAEVLARSDRYLQAFRLGPNAYGVQFHPEVVPKELESWIRAYRLELERERLTSEDVLNVPNERDHRRLAFQFGENIAAWIRQTDPSHRVL
jgi:GMP synthase (glutamine-hydrolysing)